MNYKQALELFSSGVLRSHDPRSVKTCQGFIDACDQHKIESISKRLKRSILNGKCAITSDLHLNHKNIIEYCNRPFKDVEDMNESLYDFLLDAKDKYEEILIVGDVLMGAKDDGISMLGAIKELLGMPMHLVLGNHDMNRSKKSFFPEWLFYSETSFLWFEHNNKTIMFSHYPLFVDANSLRKANIEGPLINVHGHTHNYLMTDTEHVKYVNVCWDNLKSFETLEFLR